MDEPVGISTKGDAPLKIYPCKYGGAAKEHDADTFHMTIPLDVMQTDLVDDGYQPVVRLAHVNAAELQTADGVAAKNAVIAWFGIDIEFLMLIWGREKYGRVLADIIRMRDGAVLSDFVKTLPGSKLETVGRQLGVVW